MYNRNLPVWSTYEPGSTFKIITLAAALNENLVDLEKIRFMMMEQLKLVEQD
ncbi:penicillin-binding transpeptidase domain-containing protein [Bacillus paranthracis]